MPNHLPSSVLVAASMPWAFSQQHPLGTSDFCRAAAKRGIDIEEQQLRELWRVGALAPLVEVRNRQANDPSPSAITEPLSGGTTLCRSFVWPETRGGWWIQSSSASDRNSDSRDHQARHLARVGGGTDSSTRDGS